jgi:hypothetical protein
MKFYIEPSSIEKGLLEETSPSVIEVETKNIAPEKPWDTAHSLVKSQKSISLAEPLMDYIQDIGLPASHNAFLDTGEKGDFELLESIFDEDWGRPDPPAIWHLADGFSELKPAYDSVKNINPEITIRVAHLDTGYDPDHSVSPNFRRDLQKNFVEPDRPNDATDPNIRQGLISNAGHGTGTSGILAGKEGEIPTGEAVAIGAAPFVEVIPIRISNSVVLIKSDAFVEAMNYIMALSENPETRIHVVTMSMGGVASKAWAKVINQAYEKGIFVVTAAGNNFGRTTPRTLVYPSRFNRVVAACGITYDLRPYSKMWGTHFKEMQGNFGPKAIMRTAVSAFTPNMPWAQFGTKNKVSFSGGGTSSATPQIAAAAAMYWKKYHGELSQLVGWQQVETIRQAMFASTNLTSIKSTEGDELDDSAKMLFFGRGQLRAMEMLKITPESLSVTIKKEAVDKVSLPFWRVILGTKSLFESEPTPEEEMYQIEILQLIQISVRLQELLDYEEKSYEDLNTEERIEYLQILENMDEASESLKEFLRRLR